MRFLLSKAAIGLTALVLAGSAGADNTTRNVALGIVAGAIIGHIASGSHGDRADGEVQMRVSPAPVYLTPPVVYAPAPVYYTPPTYFQPAPVYAYPVYPATRYGPHRHRHHYHHHYSRHRR